MNNLELLQQQAAEGFLSEGRMLRLKFEHTNYKFIKAREHERWRRLHVDKNKQRGQTNVSEDNNIGEWPAHRRYDNSTGQHLKGALAQVYFTLSHNMGGRMNTYSRYHGHKDASTAPTNHGRKNAFNVTPHQDEDVTLAHVFWLPQMYTRKYWWHVDWYWYSKLHMFLNRSSGMQQHKIAFRNHQTFARIASRPDILTFKNTLVEVDTKSKLQSVRMSLPMDPWENINDLTTAHTEQFAKSSDPVPGPSHGFSERGKQKADSSGVPKNNKKDQSNQKISEPRKTNKPPPKDKPKPANYPRAGK
ncbi:hypothetical protein DFJ58DRAFT_912659 [Suillus subalutaceus]|uniref:uncharacterized protein n=1 Tax=Suillus subalutaceus TaxID=48586 RepID=UPI001B85BF0E|nr:uncharacterized protein DFJ58DRAFT_912659 [Suillus subalutaceus]KAG1862107.1 hypothetical protein DFJ58DRAFT_912659 [Suillus subalutaceus]